MYHCGERVRAPTAFFLKVLYLPIYSPVPRQAIEAAQRRAAFERLRMGSHSLKERLEDDL